jgi:hypothetical protein
MAQCESCGAEIVWVTLLTLEGGRQHPMDAAPLAGAAVGCLAFNPRTGTAMVLTADRMQKRLGELLEKGAEFHASHFETCASAERHRGVSRDQEALF